MNSFIVLTIMFVPILILIGSVLLFRWIDKRKKRRSPLTSQLLRMPGESLLRELNEIQMEIYKYSFLTIVYPILFYSLWISEKYFKNTMPNSTMMYSVIIMGLLSFSILKTIKLTRKRRNLQLGFECEVAVGQELNQLMRDGYYVYHDFQADKFNIDHIVIGSGGVFAVETKGRTKPTSADASADARIFYDGKCLKFPHYSETDAIEQSLRQAKWLADFLSKAAGESVKVIPVVTLPGWFVESDEKDKKYVVRVINPKMIVLKLKEFSKQLLSEESVTRIAYQVEQRCRNVQLKAYVETNPHY
jgi:hypothetical protein